jgi:peptidoglycan/LPS O-acetylase OafA/YrhL
MLRIFPLYYLLLIVFLLILPNVDAYSDNLKYYTDNQWWLWTYLQNWLYVFKVPEDTNVLLHLWSLAVEEQYYLIWPFVILLIRKPKWLLILSLLILVFIMVLRLILWYNNIEGLHYFGLYTFTRIDGLCIGSALALIRILKPNFMTNFTAPVILSVAALNFAFYFINKINNFSFPYFAFIGYTTFAVVFAVLVHEAATVNKNLITNILKISPLRFLGKISYGFYIFHWPVYLFLSPVLIKYLSNRFQTDHLYIQITSALIATLTGLLVSIASYYLFEMKFLKLKKYFS